MVSIDILASQFVIALMISITYFLVAVGLSMYFGILGVINFAHGEFYALGAYVGLTIFGLFSGIAGSYWIALLASPIVVGLIGFLFEKPLQLLYDRDPTIILLITFGFSIVMREGIKVIWGTGPRSLSTPSVITFDLTIFGILVPGYWIFVLLVTLVLIFVIFYTFYRTAYGLYLRAAAYDRELLSMFAIDSEKIYSITFIVSVALAGLAGFLIAPIRSLNPQMGLDIIIIAFVVIIIGGLGSVTGTLVASFMIGFTQVYSELFIPQFGLIPVFGILILVILQRPEGLMGETGRVH